MKIAFLIQKFPQTSEVFIIDQVADLIDRGVDVRIFRFEEGDPTHVSERFTTYAMLERTTTIAPPPGVMRFLAAPARIVSVALRSPALLLRSFNIATYGRSALSLQMLWAAAAFADDQFDLVHCHFGRIANRYLPIRKLLKHSMPLLTSFYGYDVSSLPKDKGESYYDELKRECHAYIVMSNNMKERVIALGFPAAEVTVLPVSIGVDEIRFEKRIDTPGMPVEIVSVGRFVEKKGFDDFLRALAIVKEKALRPFHATLIGGGELEKPLKQLADDLHLNDVVTFTGYMKLQDVMKRFYAAHLYVQPSKTASNGDME